MAEAEQKRPPLRTVGPNYATRVTIFTYSGVGYDKVLDRDARRYAVRFYSSVNVTTVPFVHPGPPAEGFPTGIVVPAPLEYEWGKWPATTQGEFYAFSADVSKLIIIEELYLRS